MAPFVTGFMIPVVLIGIILVWVKRKSVGNSILWSLWPFLLWYPAYLLMTVLSIKIDTANSQKIDLIYPENFTGESIVVGESKCGQEKIIKEGREQLYIPKNGVLLYQGSFEPYGLINHHHYYRGQNDSLKLIPLRSANGMFWDTLNNRPPEDMKVVWGSGIGPMELNGNYLKATCLSSKIGSLDSLRRYDKLKLYEKIDETTEKVILNCQ